MRMVSGTGIIGQDMVCGFRKNLFTTKGSDGSGISVNTDVTFKIVNTKYNDFNTYIKTGIGKKYIVKISNVTSMYAFLARENNSSGKNLGGKIGGYIKEFTFVATTKITCIRTVNLDINTSTPSHNVKIEIYKI